MASTEGMPGHRRRREDAGGELSAELPVTARQVLEAARRIVSERGLAALTLDAVAEESGNYRSAIRYHFGDKAGLVSAVLDSTALTPVTTPLFAGAIGAEPGPARVGAHVAALKSVTNDREEFRLFWSLLPHILRDEELRGRLDHLYEDYRRINADALGVETPDASAERRLLGLVSLLTAVCDGLGLLGCLGDDEGSGVAQAKAPQADVIDAAYEVLGEMLEAYLPKLAAADGAAAAESTLSNDRKDRS